MTERHFPDADAATPINHHRRKVLLAGLAGSTLGALTACGSAPVSNDRRSSATIMPLASLTATDWIHLHAALQLQMARRGKGWTVAQVKEQCAALYTPADGEIAAYRATGATLPAVAQRQRERFDRFIGPHTDRFENVALSTTLKKFEAVLDADMGKHYRDGGIVFASRVDAVEHDPIRDDSHSTAQLRRILHGQRPFAEQWDVVAIRGRASAGELFLIREATAQFSIPYDSVALRKLITDKIMKDPQGLRPGSRTLKVTADVDVQVLPRVRGPSRGGVIGQGGVPGAEIGILTSDVKVIQVRNLVVA